MRRILEAGCENENNEEYQVMFLKRNMSNSYVFTRLILLLKNTFSLWLYQVSLLSYICAHIPILQNVRQNRFFYDYFVSEDGIRPEKGGRNILFLMLGVNK